MVDDSVMDVEEAEFEEQEDYVTEDEEPAAGLLDGEDEDSSEDDLGEEDDYESDEEPSDGGEEDAW